ncbi:hypothetical protein NE237_027768 [Protea cynaroides]|uniref:RBR-type E3 ubiquitin transferase n=1 Tax=Protea cynaroides TaxID=273540 RepID=A0A9Q0GPY4_9MAGN|nr:hypothetical protein NE237_027768 [Protea cynaroides]
MDNPDLPENSKEVESCEICIELMTQEIKFENNKRCVHPFCTDCIVKYIEAKVEERVTKLLCPAFNCKKLLDPFSCRQILPAGLFEKWCDLLCESAVVERESAYCPFADCSALILNECEGNITRSNCPNCKKLMCFQCKLPWHVGFRCDETQEMRDENDIFFSELVDRNKWKRCPGCNFHVERFEGCQNIKCRCGVLFCYTCGRVKSTCECYRKNVVVVEGHDRGNRVVVRPNVDGVI